jgi:hypothetical protein
MGKNNLFDFHNPSRLVSANAGRGRNNQGCMIRKSDKIPGHCIPIRAAGHPSIMARYPPTLLRIRCPCNLEHTQYPDQQDDASQISWIIFCWVVSRLCFIVRICILLQSNDIINLFICMDPIHRRRAELAANIL